MILEDNVADAEIITSLLKKSSSHHTIFIASNRNEFIRILHETEPDLILSDKALPQFDGMEALRLIREHSPDIPFIMITGTVSEEFSAEIIKMGADDFLLKDRLARLPNAIEKAINKRAIEKEKRIAEEGNRNKAELLNTIAQAVMATNKYGSLNFWNKAACDIYGWTEHEAKGKNIFELFQIVPKDLKKYTIMDELKGGNSWEGELIATSKSGNIFPVFLTVAPVYDADKKFSGAIAVSADITETKKTEKELQELNSQLHRLSGHLEKVREEERMRVAKEIHDEMAQQLTGLKIEASLLFKTLEIKDEMQHQKANEIISLIDETLKSGLRILSNLRPTILDDLGLIAALEWHSEEVKKLSGIEIHFTSDSEDLKMNEIKSTALFRIYQEILMNITGIAGTSSVISNLMIKKGEIVLKVKGKRERPAIDSTKKEKGLDIIEIEERVYNLGGLYDMKIDPETGTQIKITIPL